MNCSPGQDQADPRLAELREMLSESRVGMAWFQTFSMARTLDVRAVDSGFASRGI